MQIFPERTFPGQIFPMRTLAVPTFVRLIWQGQTFEVQNFAVQYLEVTQSKKITKGNVFFESVLNDKQEYLQKLIED